MNLKIKKMEEKFNPPFRLGKKNNRAVLDSSGKELVIFQKGSENYAKAYVDFLNIYDSQIYQALEQLVLLKKHKDKFGKDAFYLEKQPLIWENALKIIEKNKNLFD